MTTEQAVLAVFELPTGRGQPAADQVIDLVRKGLPVQSFFHLVKALDV